MEIKPEPILTPEMAKLLSEFRSQFPEFKEEKYPNALVIKKLFVATHYIDEERLGDLYTYAVALVAAHLLVMADRTLAADGTVTGDANQTVSSKSVGGVSVSYSTGVGAANDIFSSFKYTSYGEEYLSIIRLFGMGVICI